MRRREGPLAREAPSMVRACGFLVPSHLSQLHRPARSPAISEVDPGRPELWFRRHADDADKADQSRVGPSTQNNTLSEKARPNAMDQSYGQLMCVVVAAWVFSSAVD